MTAPSANRNGGNSRRRTVATWVLRVGAGLGLFAAGAFAALRIGQPASVRLVEAVAFTYLGVPAALVGVLAAAGAWRGRPRQVAVGLAVILLGIHVTWQAPLFVGARPAGDPRCGLTVLTQNLESGNGPALVELVENRAVDVLVVAEGAAGPLATVLPRLTEHLPYTVGVTRGRPSPLVVLSRHPVQSSTDAPDGRARFVRIGTCAGPVSLVAMHPGPPYGLGAWARDHDNAYAFVVAQFGRDLANERVLIAGDLNATLDHAPVQRLLSLGLRDAAELANTGWAPTFPAPGGATRLGVPVPTVVTIDHILVSELLTVGEATTVTVPGADHLGLLAVVRPRLP